MGLRPVVSGGKSHAGFTVVEALVELFAEGVGEAGDFTGAFHKVLRFEFLVLSWATTP